MLMDFKIASLTSVFFLHCFALAYDYDGLASEYMRLKLDESHHEAETDRLEMFDYAEYISREDTVQSPVFYLKDYEQLTRGIDEIDIYHHHSSQMTVFGNQSFPIATDRKGDPMIAGAFYGKGKVIALGAYPYAYLEKWKPFIDNVIAWQTNNADPANIRIASRDGRMVLKDVGKKVVNVWPEHVSTKDYDIYIVDAQRGMSEDEVKHIHEFVQNGGGLIIGGHAWWWQAVNKSKLPKFSFALFPGNRILLKFGIMIRGWSWSRRNFPTKEMPLLEQNLYYAAKYVIEKGFSKVALMTIINQADDMLAYNNRYHPEMEEIIAMANPLYIRLKEIFDPSVREIVMTHNKVLIVLLSKMIESGGIDKAPNVATFPYETPNDAERVTETIILNGTFGIHPTYPGSNYEREPTRLSTGLYAAAGEIVKLKLDQNFVDMITNSKSKLQFVVMIGAHSDGLYGKHPLKRSPEIVARFPITAPTMVIGNPWGGLIYITIPQGTYYGEFSVTIENVVKAPRYILGKTSLDEWMDEIRHFPGPWAEFEVPNQIIFTVPSSKTRDLEDPDQLLGIYKEVMHEVNWLNGLDSDDERMRAERIVLDITPSAGWMHAGYPIVGYDSYTKSMMNSTLVKQGKWGEIHELGHNMALSYRIGATNEAVANVWTVYINTKVLNMNMNARGSSVSEDAINRAITWYILDGRKYSNYGTWTSLYSYMILLNEIGYDKWRKVNIRYHSIRSRGSAFEKLNLLTRVFCEEAKLNVAPYFEWWGIPTFNETNTTCSKFPQMERNLMAKYEEVDHTTIIDHGDCQDGWIPYGNSCFFISAEKVNWYDANEKCIEADSHLASCLSTKEAYFLKSTLKSMNLNDAFYVGIDTLNENSTPVYLNGSKLPELMPWARNEPYMPSVRSCTTFINYELKQRQCLQSKRYICKKGPSSCGANWSCPPGWSKRGSKCYWIKYGGARMEEGIDDCIKKESTMVAIESKEEYNWLVDIFKHMRHTGQYYWKNYWLNINLNNTWGNGDDVTYGGNWCEGEYLGQKPNTLVIMKSNQYCWMEWYPVNWESYICQKPAIINNNGM